MIGETCDLCDTVLDGPSFGRRVLDTWCWRCWFKQQDEAVAEDEERATDTRGRKLTKVIGKIERLQRQLAECKSDLKHAEGRCAEIEGEIQALEVEEKELRTARWAVPA